VTSSRRDRVLRVLQESARPLDDDELARRTGIEPRQSVNQVCRQLAGDGVLRRYVGPSGKVVNELAVPSDDDAGPGLRTEPAVSQVALAASSAGTWRVSDGGGVAFREAMTLWAAAARDVLIDVAKRYHAYITYAQLAEEVQLISGVRTRSQMRNWIGKVLAAVVEDCHRRDEPPLTALCVHQDESVGDGYRYVLEVAGQAIPDDLDAHAAEARLACYRFFGADLPPDGGRPALPPAVVAARRRAARAEVKPVDICPTCFTALPRTGRCDTCG
jgi:hypothetical protein